MGKKKRPTIHAYFGTEAEEYGHSKWMKRNQQKTARYSMILLESEQLGGKLLHPLDEQKILDIGCGTGYSSEIISSTGSRVIGIEISPDMIYQIDKNSAIHPILADMRYIPLRDSKINHAISISAFNFASEGGRTEEDFLTGIERSIIEVARNLSENGRVVIEFYPTQKELEIFMKFLKQHHFTGGLLIENQGTKKEKKYLLLKNGP